MTFSFYHCNINVRELERSVKFYADALDMKPVREKEAEDGSFKLVFLANEAAAFQIELTWLRDHADRDYDLFNSSGTGRSCPPIAAFAESRLLMAAVFLFCHASARP